MNIISDLTILVGGNNKGQKDKKFIGFLKDILFIQLKVKNIFEKDYFESLLGYISNSSQYDSVLFQEYLGRDVRKINKMCYRNEIKFKIYHNPENNRTLFEQSVMAKTIIREVNSGMKILLVTNSILIEDYINYILQINNALDKNNVSISRLSYEDKEDFISHKQVFFYDCLMSGEVVIRKPDKEDGNFRSEGNEMATSIWNERNSFLEIIEEIAKNE